MTTAVGWWLLGVGTAGLAAVFAGYPLVAWLAGVLSRRPHEQAAAETTSDHGGDASPRVEARPLVSVIVAMRNAEALVGRKIASLKAQLDLDGRIEVLLASDGSTDDTVTLIEEAAASWPAIRVVALPDHGGKHMALNAAVEASTAPLLVFTDVDAVLEPRAIRYLVDALSSPGVGGVCGRRMIGEPDAFVGAAQNDYVALDSGLKGMESRSGSITSNDGKLFAIQRALFEPVPAGVTDDLFTSMSVVRQGARFTYEGRARAWIRSPSRSTQHELSRRRRIVCRSLRGISSQRAVLNPRRTGLYALGLATNKIGRRLVPVFLLACMLGTAALAFNQGWARWFLALKSGAIAAALLQPLFTGIPLPAVIAKGLALGHYFIIGSVGTLLGLVDFALNRQVTRWDPIKAD